MTKKLYRSRSNRMIAGVCGGLGEYLGLDATIIRVFFLVMAVVDGIGVLAYFALWLIVPREGAVEDATVRDTVREGVDEIVGRAQEVGEGLRTTAKGSQAYAGIIIGAALILFGAVFLLRNLGFQWMRWLRFDVMWPVVLIAGGILLLFRRVKGD